MSYFKNLFKFKLILFTIVVVIIYENFTDLKTILGINNWTDLASVITIIGVITGVFFYISSIKWNFYRYLADLYYVILAKSFEHPDYCDPKKTRNYENEWRNNPQKHEYEIFARTCWAFLEDIYDTSLKSNLVLAKNNILQIYAPTFERIKTIHGVWLKNNKTVFPMKGFIEFVDSNKWRDCLEPSKVKLLRWNDASHDYDEKILNPLQVKKNNPLLEYIKRIKDQELVVADVGCGNGSLIVNHLESDNRFKKIYGIDYSDSMINIANEKCKDFKKVEFLRLDIKDLKRLRKELDENKLDMIFSINSLLAENPNDIDEMMCQISLTLKSGGKFIAVLPSFDTVEHLRKLEFENFKIERKEYNKICFKNAKIYQKIAYKSEALYEFFKFMYYLIKFRSRIEYSNWKWMTWDNNEYGPMLDTWKLFYKDRIMNDKKKLYADDGVNIQRFFQKNDIKPLFEKFGLNLVQDPEKLYYPWDLAEKFGYGYFPQKEKIWDWFVVGEKNKR